MIIADGISQELFGQRSCVKNSMVRIVSDAAEGDDVGTFGLAASTCEFVARSFAFLLYVKPTCKFFKFK